ncbi:MAG: hypothetical protein HWD59_10300 [Coxiellaceae bacterium]|nr:MAG: hypothetical protein HWD59_10300 [Coxiellaceae bacterium]
MSGEKNVEIHIPKFSITIKSDQLTQDKIAELVDKATFLKRIASLLPPDEAHEENDIESSQEHDIKYYISTLVNSHADENNNNNVVATSHKQESAAKLKASITREIFKKTPMMTPFAY